MNKKRVKTVLLLGSYGQTNLGDDLLMYNFVSLLRELGFIKIYTNVSVASNVPMEIAEFVCMVETYNTSILDWFKIIRKVDVVCYGGGTIFKELYGSTSRSKYSVIFRIMLFNLAAKFFGKPIYSLNIGIGSLKTFFGRLITKISLTLCEISIFRDIESFNFAKNKLKISYKRIALSDDGLFINKKWHDAKDVRLIEKNPIKVGFNALSDIPDWVDRDKYIHELRDFANSILERGYHVVFMPFQHAFNENNDFAFIEKELIPYLKFENYELIENIQIGELTNVFKEIDFFVGMRFHSLLMAISTATPFLAIEYDTKCSRLIREHSYPYSLKLEDISSELLLQKFDLLLLNKKENISFLTKLSNDLFSKEFLCEKELWKKLEK